MLSHWTASPPFSFFSAGKTAERELSNVKVRRSTFHLVLSRERQELHEYNKPALWLSRTPEQDASRSEQAVRLSLWSGRKEDQNPEQRERDEENERREGSREADKAELHRWNSWRRCSRTRALCVHSQCSGLWPAAEPSRLLWQVRWYHMRSSALLPESLESPELPDVQQCLKHHCSPIMWLLWWEICTELSHQYTICKDVILCRAGRVSAEPGSHPSCKLNEVHAFCRPEHCKWHAGVKSQPELCVAQLTPPVDDTQTLDSLLFCAFLNQRRRVRFHCAEPHSFIYSEMRSH